MNLFRIVRRNIQISPVIVLLFGAFIPADASAYAIVYDSSYSTFAAGCAAAGTTATFAVTLSWPGLSSYTCAANVQFFTGGLVQPASGQTLAFTGSVSGDLSRHFDTSLGSVAFAGKVKTVSPFWFGAVMDGSTDDTAAWTKALAACPATGCELDIPSGATSYTTTGISVTRNSYILIRGAGSSSAISCSGVVCVAWNAAAPHDSGMQDLSIIDPTGNAATVALKTVGGTKLHFRNLDIIGKPVQSGLTWASVGTGIIVDGSINVNFDTVTVQYWGTGLLATGGSTNALRLDKVNLQDLGYRGWDVEASGDMTATQCDFEGAAHEGIYMAWGVNMIYVSQSHFEANAVNQFELAGGYLFSTQNAYAGGTALIDNSSILLSTQDSGPAVLTNNSAGQSLWQLPGAIFFFPVQGPTTVTGTGFTQGLSSFGSNALGNPGRPYAFGGAPSYSFDNPVTLQPIPAKGTLASLACTSGNVGQLRTIIDASNSPITWNATVTGGGSTYVTAVCSASTLTWKIAGY